MAEHADVPYIVHEALEAKHERTVKRLIIAVILTVILLFASNISWLIYISSYDYVSYEYSQEGEGLNIVGDSNGVTLSESKIEDQSAPEEKPEQGQG